MSDISGLLFDLDGLLVDTERPFIHCFEIVSKRRGYDIPEELLIRMIGLGVREEEVLFQERFGKNFPYMELREETYLETKIYHDNNGMRVMPGAAKLLNYVKSKGYAVGLATGTMYERTLWKLDVSGLAGKFDAITTGSDVTRGKPAPDIFLAAAQKINLPPENCVGFEDSEVGLRALDAAGMRSIFVKDIINPAPEVLAKVWKRFTSLDEAIALF
ncbi:MAG: HAD family phosphatase [Spirochaetaceae bacterium]|jgi:HAD superfamily hydrolase (TIGR01509 family)|nr:HAD family phosphatase [Spirochaetaceae bacterium]